MSGVYERYVIEEVRRVLEDTTPKNQGKILSSLTPSLFNLLNGLQCVEYPSFRPPMGPNTDGV